MLERTFRDTSSLLKKAIMLFFFFTKQDSAFQQFSFTRGAWNSYN
jgi:hypothetical protein